jgi:hypothetical protein
MRTSILRFVSFVILTVILVARSALAQGPAAPGSGAPQPPVVSIQSISPNPFSSRTTISYTVATAGHLVIRTFDINGREIQTPASLDAQVAKGSFTLDVYGKFFDASGTYFCKFVWENQAPVTCNLSFEK